MGSCDGKDRSQQNPKIYAAKSQWNLPTCHAIRILLQITGMSVWVYTYTYGTNLASSRKPRGNPTENPTKHPWGTWRPSGRQGPSVRHWALLSQPCTTSENTGEAIQTLVLVTSPLRPPPERANIRTYVPWGKLRLQIRTQYGSTCTGDSRNTEVGFNTIMYYVLWS